MKIFYKILLKTLDNIDDYYLKNTSNLSEFLLQNNVRDF